MAGENKSVNGRSIWAVGSSWVGTLAIVLPCGRSARMTLLVAGDANATVVYRAEEPSLIQDAKNFGRRRGELVCLGGFSDDEEEEEEEEEGSASSSWLIICHSIRDQVHAGGAQRDGTSGCRDRHRLHGDRWMKKRCVRRLSILRATWMKVSTVGVEIEVGPRFGGLDFLALSIEKEGGHRWRYKRQVASKFGHRQVQPPMP